MFSANCHFQRLTRKPCCRACANTPTNQLASGKVKYRSQVAPFATNSDIGQVREPHRVRFVNRKVLSEQIVIGFCVWVGFGCLRFVFAFDLGFDSTLVHDSLHFAATDFYSVIV